MRSATTIKGFGGTTLFATGLVFCSRGAGLGAQLHDATGEMLTGAEDICRRNPNLVEKMLKILYTQGETQ